MNPARMALTSCARLRRRRPMVTAALFRSARLLRRRWKSYLVGLPAWRRRFSVKLDFQPAFRILLVIFSVLSTSSSQIRRHLRFPIMTPPGTQANDANLKPDRPAGSAVPSSVSNPDSANPSRPASTTVAAVSTKVPNRTSLSVSKPELRSRPAPTAVKVEPNLSIAPEIPTSTVINVDEDWCDTSPLDHSTMMEGVVSKLPNPPNELESAVAKGLEKKIAGDPPSMRAAPPQGLPVGSLRPVWLSCAKPVTTIDVQYLQLEDVKCRTDVSVLRATTQLGHGTDSEAKWCVGATSRFMEVHKGYYHIPVSIKCDRSFLERPGDAIYIERMWLYLFNDSESLPPICTDARLYEVVVSADKSKVQQHQIMWAILIMRRKVVTFEDFFTSRRSMIDLSKATVSDSDSDPLLCISWDLFPEVPKWLTESVDLRSAHMTPIRALIYFTKTARCAGSKVFQRWNKSLQIELAIHTTVAHFTAWAHPVIDQSRIWFPTPAHVKWLKEFVNLPPIPVYYEALSKHVMVTVREVVAILEDVLARATPLVRKDYRTKTMVKFVATPNAQVFVRDPLREAVLTPTEITPASSGPVVPSVPHRTPLKSNVSATLSVKGVMFGRILKREALRKHTRIPSDVITALRGSGPWTAAEVFDHLVARSGDLVTANHTLTTEAESLRTDMTRLREDVVRYREDATRLNGELRQLRESQGVAAGYGSVDRRYDEGGRGYGSRGYYDPYDRRY